MHTAVNPLKSSRRSLAVTWADVSWEMPTARWLRRSPGMTRTLQHDASVTRCTTCRPTRLHSFSITMKTSLHTPRHARAFTLIELLVVIAIIAILAGLILPAVNGVKGQAKRKLAKAEINMIASAIKDYEASYDRYPASKDAEGYANNAANPATPDFTFFDDKITGLPPVSVGLSPRDNRDVMQILLDIDQPNGSNENHKRNPKKTQFINAKPAIGSGPGVDANGVFRDAWGNPYVITIDMNDDGKCIDAFYRKVGGNGLVQIPVGKPNAGSFELNSPVMVWSYGPDGFADINVPANEGVNKDNILSWSTR